MPGPERPDRLSNLTRLLYVSDRCPGYPQPGPHPLQGSRYGYPGHRDGANYVPLGFLSGVGGEEVLGVPQLTVRTSQVLVEALHSLSVVELCHSYPPNILRHPDRGYRQNSDHRRVSAL
jgi:hypothetical protein